MHLLVLEDHPIPVLGHREDVAMASLPAETESNLPTAVALAAAVLVAPLTVLQMLLHHRMQLLQMRQE